MCLIDNDGYLVNLSDWNKSIAHKLASQKNIKLTESHWELILLIRRFYNEFQHSPSQRPLVKYLENHLGKEKGNSLYLAKLFPGSSAKLLALIAGLPKPPNCF